LFYLHYLCLFVYMTDTNFDVCITVFISCDCMMNSSSSYTIIKITELDCCQIDKFM
jgi:hypothetical protein